MPEIYLHVDGQQAGPYQLAEIQQFLAEGRITGETPAWHKDLAAWSTVAQLLPQFAGGRPGMPPPFVPPPPVPGPAKKGMSGCLIAAIIGAAILVLLVPCCAGIALGPITMGIKKAQESASMQQAREISLAMLTYSMDHNGVYPDGATSTEVFQKLVDGKYISDPHVFYVAMPGKVKATSNQLTADNVSFDATSGVTSDSSDSVPVVFLTGYTVIYEAGASAARDGSRSTPFPGPGKLTSGIAVAYKGNNARFIAGDENGTIVNFVPPGFQSGTHIYQQLRP